MINFSVSVKTYVGKSWVAAITGRDAKYGIARTFVHPISREVSRSGRTGEWTYYLTPGLYQVQEPNGSRINRYFIRVTEDGWEFFAESDLMAEI
jgi:hypothetical protein